MKEQATWVEVSTLRLHSMRLKLTIKELTAQRSKDKTPQQVQREAWAKEWEETFWASPDINDKFIDQDFAFL